MPSGIYKRTIDQKLKTSNSLIGRKKDLITREKMRIAKIGIKHTKEHNIKIGLGSIGIKRSELSKEKNKQSHLGEKNSQWRGGISFEPYGLEFNEDLKEVIRNRDRRKCQVCGKTELEEGNKLSIHHIDYDKKHNDPKNLITLCWSCHSKTNHNRTLWESYFIRRFQFVLVN